MKVQYRAMNEKILPKQELKDKVMEKVMPRRCGMFRPAAAIAAVLVVAMMTIPVMAAAVPWILEYISPILGKELEPVRRGESNNGITMEVVAATAWENRAELVVKVEGELLKEPVGVAPFFEVNSDDLKGIDIYSILNYEGVQEDMANGIYYYQVLMTYRKDLSVEEQLGGEMTVQLDTIRISGFSSGEVEVPIMLSDPEKTVWIGVDELEDYGYPLLGSGDSDEYPYDSELGSWVIKPNDETVYDVTDKLGLAGAMYLDGKLHIQVRAVDAEGVKADWNYRGPYLLDMEGNKVARLYSNYFSKDGTQRIDYAEFIYDIPPEKLEHYTMVVILEYHDEIPADCSVTFSFTEDEVMTE